MLIIYVFLSAFCYSQSITQIDKESTSEYLDSLRNLWDVPGVAVAVVKDGEIIYSNGFGSKSSDEFLPVSSKTLFCLGSSSKAFTSFACSLLAENGKLDFNKPIIEYIPWFRLKDEYATSHLNSLDLLTHRSGLPKHPFCREIQPGSIKEFVKRVQFLNNNGGLREKWQYSNINYIILTCLIEELTGSSWDNYYTENIFKPLNMSRTYCNAKEALIDGNVAYPYLDLDTSIVELGFYHDAILSGAGTIYSNVDDMANWLILHLSNGNFEEKEIISPRALSFIHTPHSSTPWPVMYSELFYQEYGLGWFVSSYRGHKHVHHAGVLMGYSALVSFLPGDNIGIVVLANKNGTDLTKMIERYFYDMLLELDMIDWSSRFLNYQKRVEEYYANYDPYKNRVENTTNSHELEDYFGKYYNEAYGEVEIQKLDGHLVIDFEGGTSKMEHYHYDVFEFFDDVIYMGGKLQFETDVETGVISGFNMYISQSGSDEVYFGKI